MTIDTKTESHTYGQAQDRADATPRQAPDVFREAIIILMPSLRAFAATRVSSSSEVDDLVQETLARALRYRNSFREGTNLKAWLCKILQNCFYHDIYKQRDTVEDIEGRWAAKQSVDPAQEWHIEYNDMLAALEQLPPDARSALLLIAASGCSYEEAALLSDCPIGTLKSRVNRAREKLAQLMGNQLDTGRRTPAEAPDPFQKPRPFQEQAHQMSLQNARRMPSREELPADQDLVQP